MKTKKFLALILALAIVHSCAKKAAADFNSNPTLFTKYISSFSSGIVSATSDIKVQLAINKSDWKPNQELDDNLFTITPSISGKVVALSNNTIAFIPKNKLKANTIYNITLHLSEIVNTTAELKDFKFSIKTIQQDFIVSTQDLQSYNQNLYYLNGTLKTADDISFDDAQKLIQAEQNSANLKVKFDKILSTKTEFKLL